MPLIEEALGINGPLRCCKKIVMFLNTIILNLILKFQDWLFKQLCTCSSPVHPLLLPLIETYIHSIITPLNISRTKQQRMNALQPFSEERLFAVFRDKSVACCDSETTKLLLMLYALMYQNALLGNMKTLGNMDI